MRELRPLARPGNGSDVLGAFDQSARRGEGEKTEGGGREGREGEGRWWSVIQCERLTGGHRAGEGDGPVSQRAAGLGRCSAPTSSLQSSLLRSCHRTHYCLSPWASTGHCVPEEGGKRRGRGEGGEREREGGENREEGEREGKGREGRGQGEGAGRGERVQHTCSLQETAERDIEQRAPHTVQVYKASIA